MTTALDRDERNLRLSRSRGGLHQTCATKAGARAKKLSTSRYGVSWLCDAWKVGGGVRWTCSSSGRVVEESRVTLTVGDLWEESSWVSVTFLSKDLREEARKLEVELFGSR